MKQYLTDLCLVLLFICVIGLFFDDYQVSQTLFQRSLDDFEEKVTAQEEISSYVTLQDNTDNQVSSFIKGMSDICVRVIEYIVLIFSNFVSMILTSLYY